MDADTTKLLEKFKEKKGEITPENILEEAQKLVAAKSKAGHVSDKMQTDYSRFESIEDPDADPLATAKKGKEKGNECFKNGLYETAIDAYSTALDDLPDAKKKEDKAIKDLRITLHSNRAACHMKAGNFDQCIKDCDYVLKECDKTDLKTVKPLFRRAKAYESKKLYEKACKDILVLLRLDPSNKSGTKFFNKLKKKVHSRSLSAIRTALQREEEEEKKKKQERKRKASRKSAKTASSSASKSSKPKANSAPTTPDKLSKEDEKELSNISKKGYCHFRSDADSASRQIIGDIRPKKIDAGSPVPALPKAQISAVVGSEWNNAGTWEEKDQSKQATARLKELLKGISWGAAEVTKISKVEGTASYGKSRKGNFFYFEYRLEMEAKVAHSSGEEKQFKLTFPDVSSLVLDDKDDTFEMDVSAKKGKRDPESLSALNALKFHVDEAISTFANEFIAKIK